MLDIDPSVKISKHFTYREALWLPLWNRISIERDGLTQEVINTLKYFLGTHMDAVREFYAQPLLIHCCYRPRLYNHTIGGAQNSAHMALDTNIAAIDFHVEGMTCEAARALIIPQLKSFGLRLEDNGVNANWLHLDNREPSSEFSRFFKP